MIKYVFIFLTCYTCFSQENIESISFLNTELIIGRALPSYQLITNLRPKIALGLTYSKHNRMATKPWQKFLPNATTGVSLYVTDYASKNKGISISTIPFIELPINKKQNLHAKFGMGMSYFSKKYDPTNNVTNTEISTDLTWAIQGNLYYDLNFIKKRNWRLGFGFFHHSNGHSKLPNKGENTMVLSISTNFFEKHHLLNKSQKAIVTQSKNTNNWFYSVRYGSGFQAFITEDSALKKVHSVALRSGLFYKEFLKFKLSLNYRFYQHYYDYINETNTKPYIDNSFKNASNINATIGTEAVFGNVGVDLEFGVNIYKPFYKKHYDLQIAESNSGFDLKNLFLARLGLKLYAINNNKQPRNNFYIATHLNSNFGQADFNEISIGFVHKLKRKVLVHNKNKTH